MHPIQRTSSAVIDPHDLSNQISVYNARGWVVTDAWFTDESLSELCLNAIYKGEAVKSDYQAEFSKNHSWKKQASHD